MLENKGFIADVDMIEQRDRLDFESNSYGEI